MNLRGSPVWRRSPPSVSHGRRALSSALAAASLLALACGSDNSSNGSGGGTSGGSIPETCSNDVQASSLPAFSASDAIATEVQRLGVLPVGKTVPFQIPAGTVSFTIIEQAVKAPLFVDFPDGNGSTVTLPNTAVPLRVLDPSRNEFFNDTSERPADIATEMVFIPSASDSPGTGTLTAPNTSAGLSLVNGGSGFTAGTWSLHVSDYAYECAVAFGCTGSGLKSASYDVSVITKATSGIIPSAGAIDLAIYFVVDSVDGQKLSKDSAATDQDLNRMVATLTSIFKRANITVRGPTYYDLPDDVKAPYLTGLDIDSDGACSPFHQLLKNAQPGNVLNIFMVSAFKTSKASGNETVVGFDGTIPGPSTIGGTAASGAAVQVADLRHGSGDASLCPNGVLSFSTCGADATAYYIAHEAGHFMGLYHTTEATGFDFDPLDDTAQCSCSKCASLGAVCNPDPGIGDHMALSECVAPTAKSGCGGGDNLMFYVLDSGAVGLLTSQQQQVMRANPLVQ